MIEIAKRAVALEGKGFEWMPGMRISVINKICVSVAQNGDPIYQNVYGFRSPVPCALPDLTDPATLGCLLALVREAWKDEGCAAVVASYTFESGYRFRVVGGHHHGSGFMAMSKKHYQTEAEALVAALEAAP